MAQCVQSVQEFIQDSFVPMVAVLSSDEAERVSRKNNLSFSELLRPFCKLTSEGHIRDPNNQLQTVKNLRVCVNNLVTSLQTPSASVSPAQYRLLSEVVLSFQPQEGAQTSAVKTGDYSLNLSVTTPWFEAYRDNFLQSMPASDHEFLNHYLACLLVVSSTETVPVEQFLKLSQEQHRIQHSGEYTNPKWFIPNTLKYYVLLHDMSEGDEQRAELVYEDMKQRYGSHGCYLLKINSRTVSPEQDEQIPDPWSQYLLRNSQRNQEMFDLVPAANVAETSAGATEVDSSDSAETGPGLSSSLEVHPLQLDTSSASLQTLTDVHVDLKTGARDSEHPALGSGSYGACLTLNDHDHVRQFVQEFAFRGLLPHVEKNIRQLNDQLLSRKGLSRSLFTATKKWFGGGKVPEKNEPKTTSNLLYPPEAPELQIRKMADLCFLVQHYDLAYSCYHTAKKDFLLDQAMLYAAGALEMAAVSAFLQSGAPRPYPSHYMDTAIQTYRDVCRNMVLAERCALLSSEILKSQGKYSEAAALLIKMTSEDSDLRSALLLEQAAHCFINMRNPMVRKFAFHMILAGHRFSKARQTRHALRCYCQAMQVYQDRGWSLAEDHINFTIGRHSFTHGQSEDAVMAFRQILINDSRQTATQQAAFLREYLYVYKSVNGEKKGCLPELPLPYIQSSTTRVFFGHERRLAEGEKQAATHVSLDQEYDQNLSAMWCQLEEQLVSSANRGIVPNNFQPSQSCLNSQTDNLHPPLAVVEEPIIVELSFRNPLKVSLTLSNLSLLWKFTADGTSSPGKTQTGEQITGETITNEEASATQMALKDDIITAEIIKEFHMGSEETKMARLRLLPHRTGQLNIVGVVYDLTSSFAGETASNTEGQQALSQMTVRGRQDLKIRGPRLNLTKEDKMQVRYGADQRLEPIITPPMPLMEVFFLQFPTALLCGEIKKAHVEFCNVSAVALCGLRVASTHPDFFTFGSQATTPVTPPSSVSAENCSAYKTFATTLQQGSVASEMLVSAEEFSQPSGVMNIPVHGGMLQPGESIQLPLWLRGPDKEGVHEINFLFYYESIEKGPKISHRVLRHTVFICASRSLNVQASAFHSTAPPPHSVDDKGSRGTLVFIDVENVNMSEGGVREFHIVQVSSSSHHWRLHKYITPTKDNDCKLSSRERAKLCFRATRCKPRQANLDNVDKLIFADLSLGNERIISSSTPCGDFFFRCCNTSTLQQVDVNSRTSGNSRSLYSAPPSGSGTNLTSVTRKCNDLDLNIIVIWKAYVIEDNKQLILEGQLHVALHSFGKEASSLVPKEESQEMVLLKFKSELPPPVVLPFPEVSQLIKTSLHYPETFTHHFVQDSLCLVPVTLTLSNCSVALVDVIIDLRHNSTSSESLEVHGSFSWVGQTQYKLQLGQQEVVSLTLRACFFRAGVYNLNTPRVLARPTEQNSVCETSQQTASPALIIIINSARLQKSNSSDEQLSL
ncbi:trafficking protein particle complex subunit 8 [Nothobranchius furzeri]|uniref:Trafficking protein particle complex 8 n=1 Tax=Nothobranchius furzeri TaxID=105023 RepID=A0A1A8AII4_NOTFU|nr:trafficking protein particle complex subunit 8 [Nothobranchius furzeri]KAF7203778.1 trafficking protein particle complex 8 [Nothobranchius furzeri]